MNVAYSTRFQNDLHDIATSFAETSPSSAVKFLLAVDAMVDRIIETPFLFQLRPDIGRDIRKATVGQYSILFCVRDTTIKIERILHGRRDLPAYFPHT